MKMKNSPRRRFAKAAFVTGMAASLLASVSNASAKEPAPATRPASARPAVGSVAPDFTLNDLQGQAVSLAGLAEKGPVVVIVLRGWPGYQCPLCTKQVGEFVTRAKDFQQAGATLVLIYPGPADRLNEHATEFIMQTELPENFRFVTDPDYAFTNAYSLRWNAPRETAYPSTLVINQDRKVRFAYISESHGDRTNAAAVLKQVTSLGKR